jgi:hypothetical protein
MNSLRLVATALVVLVLSVGVSHAATDKYSTSLKILEILFGEGDEGRNKKLYSGKRQPDAGLAQILALPGLSITAVDGHRVKPKLNWISVGSGWSGYTAYKQLPGTYEFEVTSWKRKKNRGEIGSAVKLDKHATYALRGVLEAGQKYVLSPIWNDGEVGIIAPSQVCLQGESDDARYCALRPRESDDVFAMDEKHGVIVAGLTRRISFDKIIMINLDCEWKSTDGWPILNRRKPATKLRDVCEATLELTDSKDYLVESVDAGVWKWWGFRGLAGYSGLIQTYTFDVEPGKVNYVGHIRTTHKDGKLLGFRVEDHFSVLEPRLRAGFGDSEIVNKASELPSPTSQR